MNLLRSRYLLIGLVAAVLVSVQGGCTNFGGVFQLDEKSAINSEKIRVSKERFSAEYAVSEFDDSVMQQIGRYYWRYGTGAANLNVTYNPTSKKGHGVVDAGLLLKKYSKKLKVYGIDNINADVFPVYSDSNMVMINFDTVVAKAPRGCTEFPGMNRDSAADFDGYKLGCQMDTLLAKQIARPKDINDTDVDAAPSDANRAYNKLQGYQQGQDLGELSDDWNASDVD